MKLIVCMLECNHLTNLPPKKLNNFYKIEIHFMGNKDVWKKIAIEYLSGKDLVSLTSVSSFYRNFLNSENIWKEKCKKDFAVTFDKNSDLRKKYFILHYYKLGQEAHKLSESQHYFRNVISLIQTCPGKRETHFAYYLGIILTKGLHGNFSNIKKGIQILKYLARQNYYPALKALIDFVYQDCPFFNNFKERNDLKFFVKKLTLDFVVKKSEEAQFLKEKGVMYAKGLLFEKDLNKAVSLFNEAIRKGFKEAFCDLGAVYKEMGDLVEAEKAYCGAFQNKIFLGAHLLGDLLAIQKDRSDDSIKWYTEAYERGDHEAGLKIAATYIKNKNKDKPTIPLLIKVFMMGNTNAVVLLANCCLASGEMTKAINWLQLGIKRGSGSSALFLADLYLKDNSSNINTVLDHYFLAYELGNNKALQKITDLYLKYFDLLNEDAKAKSVYWLALAKFFLPGTKSIFTEDKPKYPSQLKIVLSFVRIMEHIRNNDIHMAEALYKIIYRNHTNSVIKMFKSVMALEILSGDEKHILQNIFNLFQNSHPANGLAQSKMRI